MLENQNMPANNYSASTNQILTEANYLDTHYLAARVTYEQMALDAEIQPGWDLLDAGAGGGSFLPLLSAQLGETGTITAIDHAPDNVDAISRRVATGEFLCPVTAQQTNIIELPFDNESFDAIWCANVFQYLTDKECQQALAEFKRVLRPGGLIALKEADFGSTTLGNDPVAFMNVVQKASRHPQLKGTFAGWLRTRKFPEMFADADIELKRYRTYLTEWYPPFSEVDAAHLTAICTTAVQLLEQLGVESEFPMYEQLAHPDGPDNYLASPEFYYRGGHALVTGTA